jgi:MFS superfamily sulfate permease-like transporter
MRFILLIILLLLVLGALPTWPYSAERGYYPSSGLGLVLVVVLILALMGRSDSYSVSDVAGGSSLLRSLSVSLIESTTVR